MVLLCCGFVWFISPRGACCHFRLASHKGFQEHTGAGLVPRQIDRCTMAAAALLGMEYKGRFAYHMKKRRGKWRMNVWFRSLASIRG
ncbi:hypothetical protein BJ875DRAFT_453195 [Amylocarpus encephaloides]|uniref:Secreted protein n=1 Tax=Amylocarpus encephaloides TaxID=45428 RepID=A0A9P8C8E8_9HELO|nr:hypothetical protein BJ875DRAFT_453195 [Amylocarpus encephaloides]